MRDILFIQGGGGTDVHDSWDNKLVDSLRREVGENYEVLYPRMPVRTTRNMPNGRRRFGRRSRG